MPASGSLPLKTVELMERIFKLGKVVDKTVHLLLRVSIMERYLGAVERNAKDLCCVQGRTS